MAAGLSLAGYGCARAGARPNILWIIAEDLSPDLACYGNKLVQTPNLDRLASQGVRFTHAFVAGPVCSASRSAIAVGMYQTSVGAHNHRSHRHDDYLLPESVRVFTHYLREAGYHTSNLTRVEGIGGTGKTDFNFNLGEPPFDGKDWTERGPGQPFYAQINFPETHRPFKRFPRHPVDPMQVEVPPYYPDHPAVRLDFATYYDDIQHLDVNAGKVLRRLEEQGQSGDTIVFFFGDHGRPMPRGKQFLYEEGIRIPLIVRIPEKFRVEGYAPGTVNDSLVSAIDITATTLRLAGVEVPSHMEGRPFFGPNVQRRDYIIAARDRCDETVDRIRCVRGRRFKYIRNFYPERPYTQQNVYKDTQYATLAIMRQLNEENKLSGPPEQWMAPTRPAEELYDLEADPYEVNNLAGKPEQQATLEEMRGTLERWIKETGDKGQYPEQGVQEQDQYRHEIDGWCTRDNALPSKSGSVLKVECFGKGAHLICSFVTEGPGLVLEFRARSTGVPVESVSWGTIEDMTNQAFRAPVDFKPDGQWHNYSVALTAPGYLAQLTLHFGEQQGAIDFEWIRLSRKSRARIRRIEQWDFA